MGWLIDRHPDHEGYVVAMVPRTPGYNTLLREAGMLMDHEERHDVRLIKAGCDCGWRSPHFRPETGSDGEPFYSPHSAFVTEADENRCRRMWEEHVSSLHEAGGGS